jgi:hypothetical protein
VFAVGRWIGALSLNANKNTKIDRYGTNDAYLCSPSSEMVASIWNSKAKYHSNHQTIFAELKATKTNQTSALEEKRFST